MNSPLVAFGEMSVRDMLRAGLGGAALAAVALLPVAASAQSSEYTELRGPRCATRDGASTCPGPAGHRLEVDGNSASEALVLRWRGGGQAPAFPPPGRDYPNGASTLGNVVEWRVESGRAIGLILRRRVEGERSRLEVYKIVGTRLCWIANVGEAEGGNTQARRLADTYRDLPCP